MKRILFLCCLVSFIPNGLYAQNQASTPLYTQIDSIILEKMKAYQIPGLAIGLVMEDAIIYSKGYGVKKIGTQEQVDETTIFHTASISKLFTGLAIMQLIEEERLSLDETLYQILPDLNFADKETPNITIRQLLNHTSGIPDINNYNWSWNHREEKRLAEYVIKRKWKTKFIPGSQFNYSNLAYDLLGYIVEKRSGQVFEDYVKEIIMKPAGMDHSSFKYFEIPKASIATPHTRKSSKGKIQIRPVYPYTREHAPSSTLNASSKELASWMRYFLQELAHSKFRQQMLESSTEVNAGIGLGFQRFQFKDFSAVGHFGGDRGFRSLLLMLPKEKIGLVLLGNCDYEEDYRQEILVPIAQLLLRVEN